jgi:hypothetical protein
VRRSAITESEKRKYSSGGDAQPVTQWNPCEYPKQRFCTPPTSPRWRDVSGLSDHPDCISGLSPDMAIK